MNIQAISESLAQPIKELVLPLPHILIRLVRANTVYFLASRGSFKTSRGIALYVLDMVFLMPRSSGALVGLSFEHLGDNTLPPLIQAFRDFGLEEGEDFVVGVKPPDHFETPYLGVYKGKYDHTITFFNGTTIHLISLVKKASANGISAQWGVFDEAKFMDEKVLVDEIFPIFRGNEKYFKHSEGYLSKFFATDKLADPVRIKWLLNKRKLNDQRRIDVVITLALQLNKLKAEYLEAGENKSAKLKKKIEEIERKLSALRQNMSFYVEASGEDTVKIMGKKWLRDKKFNMTSYEFEVSIMNKDPDRPGEGFYPDFSETKHCYTDENDIDPSKPLIIAADYQHSVSPICVCQVGKWEGKPALMYVDAIYTLDPQGLTDAVRLFCEKYRNHRNKFVYYVCDQTAVGKRVDASDFYTIVTTELKRAGWGVGVEYTGAAPDHFKKYSDTQVWLKEEEKSNCPMVIRINKDRCQKLITSIVGAGARTIRGRTEKDKRPEQESRLDQSETTHFSDVFDQINHAVLKLGRIYSATGGGGKIAAR